MQPHLLQEIASRRIRSIEEEEEEIDPCLPFPDVSVAGPLCGPSGPCKYVFRKNMKIGDKDEVYTKICRVCSDVFGQNVARVLSLPLL